MTVKATQIIKAPIEKVWQVITDFEHCVENISGIIAAEVLHRPEQGIVGLKWRETRTMFGKQADETMWISAAEPPQWYEATAHNSGAIYTSRMALCEHPEGSLLTMQFSSQATTFTARLMSLMSFLFNGALRKILEQDLRDIRDVAERS